MAMRTLTIALVAGVAAAFGGAPAATAAAPSACAADVQKYCAAAPAGGGHVLVCLQEHADQISSECQTALRSVQRHVSAKHAGRQLPPWVRACVNDINALCKDAPAGPHSISECLAQHRSALSSGCKTAFDAAK